VSILGKYTPDTAVFRVPRPKHRHYREEQRRRRARYKAEGLCSTCGGERDRSPRMTCATCYGAILRAQGYQPQPPLVPFTQKPAPPITVVHPSVYLPLRGTIALSLFHGLRRKVAA